MSEAKGNPAGDPEYAVQFVDIRKIYKMGAAEVHALDGVSVNFKKGSFWAIMGPSGSGKSTMLNLLGCLDSPTSGRYVLGGRDVSVLSAGELAQVRGERIGFVFQGYQLLRKLNALENVAFPLLLRGVPLRRREQLAMEALEKVGLCARARHLPSQLSGGQQQRVAMARALCCSPALLLCDEPTGALDQTSRDEILSLLEGLNRSGHTIVVITHDPCVAAHALKRYRVEGGRVRPAD